MDGDWGEEEGVKSRGGEGARGMCGMGEKRGRFGGRERLEIKSPAARHAAEGMRSCAHMARCNLRRMRMKKSKTTRENKKLDGPDICKAFRRYRSISWPFAGLHDKEGKEFVCCEVLISAKHKREG